MTAEQSEVLRAGLALPPVAREDVALRLLDSVSSGEDPDEVEAAWDEEILRRIEEARSSTAVMLTWDEMRIKLDEDRAARRG